MALEFGDIIEEARELHPSFVETWVPDPMALRFLGRYQRTLAGKIARLNPDTLLSRETISLPLATFTDGHEMPTAHRYGRGRVVTSTGLEEPFHLIGSRARAYNRTFPAGWIEGDVLYLVGDEADWTPYASIEVPYVAVPTLPTDATTEFDLPDSAHSLLVAAMADFFASRVASIQEAPDVDEGRFAMNMGEAQLDFLKEITTQRMARENVVEERW